MLTRAQSNNQSQLLDEIRQVDFAIYETALYLDAYPESYEAMALYQSLVEAAKKLKALYEKSAPLTMYGNTRSTSWDWVKTPWPWEV